MCRIFIYFTNVLMIQNANCFEEHDSYLVLGWVSCHHGINSIFGLLWMLILDLHNASISV